MSDSRLEEVNKVSSLSEYPASDQEFLARVVLDEKNKCQSLHTDVQFAKYEYVGLRIDLSIYFLPDNI